MANYFTADTDRYIKLFLKEEDNTKKHELFNEGIRPAFEKLIENLIFVYKFSSLDDPDTLKKDCLASMYEILNAGKFDPEKGTKGFSYFNVVAKNWFVQKARELSKRNRTERDIQVDAVGMPKMLREHPDLVAQSYENTVFEKEFWFSLNTEMESWRPKFMKKNEKNVLEAAIFLLQNPDLVPIYNKKAVYMYLREMTGLNEKQVAMCLKKIRVHYVKWKERYNEEGE